MLPNAHDVISNASPWVKRFSPLIPEGGFVLDLACGSGRHSEWLANAGHQVLAVDQDISAVQALNNPLITPKCCDLEQAEWPLDNCDFSAIVVTNYLYRPHLDRLPKMLQEGGVLIYETFALGNGEFGKPSNPNFLLNPGELLAFATSHGLKVVAYEDIYVDQPKPAMVQRLCAVKGELKEHSVTISGLRQLKIGAYSVTNTAHSKGSKKPIAGSMPAIVTPMFEDGSLDYPSLRSLLDWHVAEGTDGIVIVGTSGESPTVSVEEHCELIRVTVEQIAGRIPVIAGTGGNSTIEAIELTKYAKQVGADASLQVVPYYNKPTQEGMYSHFKKIAESVDLPVILYNVPGRTVADLAGDTVVRLAGVPGIIGIKEATGSLERGTLLINDLKRAGHQDFSVFSGDDLTAAMLMLMGGKGNISVTANIAPRLMHELCVAAMSDDVKRTREIQYQLIGVHKAMFTEANPIPVKWALHEMGKITAGIRLPLTPLSNSLREPLKAALKQANLL